MPPRIASLRPPWVVPGGRVTIEGTGFRLPADGAPRLQIGGEPAHVTAASSHRIGAIVPTVAGGRVSISLDGSATDSSDLVVARVAAVGVHQVDNPAFDGLGRLYATQSGSRDAKATVPLYRIDQDGAREPVAAEIANPTSMALGPDGAIYISSRFEGNVYRLLPDDRVELYATELGVPTGLAFGPDGTLYVGDRSGSILRLSKDRQVENFATLSPSVAAFHLAFGPDEALYVTAPTLATHDPIYRITPDRLVDVFADGFGRPQGLAFDAGGALYVVDALAGASTVTRLDVSSSSSSSREVVVSGPTMIGIAFDPAGGMMLCSNDTIWKLDVDLKPLKH